MPAREVRKTVTVIFADVTGSTSLGERLDPESLRDVMDRYFERMRHVLERHGGTIEKFIGDAVVAVFGVPTLHEDDALRAVRAAAEMRLVLGALSDELERESGVRIKARIGVNTGEIVAGDPASRQTFVTGDCVNVAARLQQNAAPGEIVIGDATRALVRDAVRAERLEPLVAKGKSAPVIAWRLDAVIADAPAIARPHDTVMVGREAQLAELRRAYDETIREHSCRLVTCLGAPGIGKSRLADEFAASVASEARVVVGRCLEYGDGITYWPITEIVRGLGGLESSVAAIPDDAERALVLGHLRRAIGEEKGGTTAEIFWGVRRMLEALARERPLIVVLDDIQWAESTLLDLIEYFVTLGTGAPALLLCLARPELLDVRPSWGTLGESARLVPVAPLSLNQSAALLDADQTSGSLPSTDRARIVDSAGGNPLFIQQMLAMIAEGATSGDVPPTVHALLAARLDRIPARERSVIDIASVEGQMFHRGAVVELSDEGDRGGAAADLIALVRRQLIKPDRSLFPGDDAFRFHHGLIRDVAYGSIAKSRRAELHERVATWLERMPGELDEFIGYHFEQACRYRGELRRDDERSGNLARRAGERLAIAGRRAFTRGDMAASVNLLGRATALLTQGGGEPGDLAVMLGSALAGVGDLARCETVLTEAVDRAAARGDRRLELHAQIERAAWRLWREPTSATTAHRLAEDAIARFAELGDDLGLARSWRLLAEAEPTWQAYADGLEQAVTYARRAGGRRDESDALWWIGVALHFGPAPVAEAIERCEAILVDVGAERTLEGGLRGILAGLMRCRAGSRRRARPSRKASRSSSSSA